MPNLPRKHSHTDIQTSTRGADQSIRITNYSFSAVAITNALSKILVLPFLIFGLFISSVTIASGTTLTYGKLINKASSVQKKNFNFETGQLVETGTNLVIGSYILSEISSGSPRAAKKTDPKYATMNLTLNTEIGQENITLQGWHSYTEKKIDAWVVATSKKNALLNAFVVVEDTANDITFEIIEPLPEPILSCDLTDPYRKLDDATVAKLNTLTSADLIKVYVKFIPETELNNPSIRYIKQFIMISLENLYPNFMRYIFSNHVSLQNFAADYKTAVKFGQFWVELPVSELPGYQNRPEVLGITLAP